MSHSCLFRFSPPPILRTDMSPLAPAVVIQEIARYNRLLAVVRTSLNDLTKALDGLLAMSQELDDVFRAFVAGAVPSTWKMACYPTLKPLAGFFDSLLRRIAMFDSWIKDRPPVVYWLPGFFFTHSFLTAIR